MQPCPRSSDNPNKRVKVLLLAGGLGTRLRPLTDRVPKCLVPIAGRPLLDYWLDRFAEGGIHDVLINTHHLRDVVRDYITIVNRGGRLHLTEGYEPTLLGSAGTVRANRHWVAEGETGLIVYADNLSTVNLAEMLQYHRTHADALTMALFHAPHPEQCGIAQLDSDLRIVEFVEKPTHPKSDLANAGIYAVSARAYREMADMNAFDLGFDVLPKFVGRMRGWVWNGYHRDIGTPEALNQAERDACELFAAGAERRS
jgi:mannose-1-phosphate guanylyltransferase